MKKLVSILLMMMVVVVIGGCGSSDNASATSSGAAASSSSESKPSSGKHVLVAYFSCTGNTKALAETTAKAVDADIFEIVPEQPYTKADLDYNDKSSRSSKETEDTKARPAIAKKVQNMSQYDTIILAYPIWWGEAPRILSTFVESYDFSGKTIVPICTSGGSDIGASGDHLAALTKGAQWKQGKRFSRDTSADELKSFFGGIGIGK